MSGIVNILLFLYTLPAFSGDSRIGLLNGLLMDFIILLKLKYPKISEPFHLQSRTQIVKYTYKKH